MKKLRLKKEIKEKLESAIFFGVCFLGIIACCMLLKAQDEQVRENAITRCGGANNIVERYTNQGDVYYTCKVEK